jgi:hypothetical protein
MKKNSVDIAKTAVQATLICLGTLAFNWAGASG